MKNTTNDSLGKYSPERVSIRQAFIVKKSGPKLVNSWEGNNPNVIQNWVK